VKLTEQVWGEKCINLYKILEKRSRGRPRSWGIVQCQKRYLINTLWRCGLYQSGSR
jgi:hypothetical protein